jgi:hypothetical protein
LFFRLRYVPPMPDFEEKLTPADSADLARSLAFALKFEGRKRWHDADALVADIFAKRLIRYLERARYVLMKRPPIGGSAPRNPPPGWPHTARENLK